MKKVYLFLICIILSGLFTLFSTRYKEKSSNDNPLSPSPTRSIPLKAETKSLFVPYWSASYTKGDFETYEKILYFGITPSGSGINTTDTGYLKLPEFITKFRTQQKKYLVLRMLDADSNFAILKNIHHKTIINESLALAKNNGFDGIVLDLELSALPFDSLIQQINSFVGNFSRSAKQQNLHFGITVYGDTFYRLRPFDIKTIAKSADEIMIMAYGLHKPGGNPGPNFPLSGKEKYGYDYKSLTRSFLAVVPAEKIAVIFGMFGYDWTVDKNDISQSSARALSLSEITQTIIDKCTQLHCIIDRDHLSGENKITYTALDGSRHIVWYEDIESVKKKQEYLRSLGINQFSFWAHSYF